VHLRVSIPNRDLVNLKHLDLKSYIDSMFTLVSIPNRDLVNLKPRSSVLISI